MSPDDLNWLFGYQPSLPIDTSRISLSRSSLIDSKLLSTLSNLDVADDVGIRMACNAISALGKIGSLQAIETLKFSLVVSSLSIYYDKEDMSIHSEPYKHDWELREVTINALANIGPNVITPLVTLFKKLCFSNQKNAPPNKDFEAWSLPLHDEILDVLTLIMSKNSDFVPLLANDLDPAIRFMAIELLEKISYRSKFAITLLDALSNDSDTIVRSRASQALLDIKNLRKRKGPSSNKISKKNGRHYSREP